MKKTIVSAIALAVVATFLVAGNSSAGPSGIVKPGIGTINPTITTFKQRLILSCTKKYPGFNITSVEKYPNNRWACISKEHFIGWL